MAEDSQGARTPLENIAHRNNSASDVVEGKRNCSTIKRVATTASTCMEANIKTHKTRSIFNPVMNFLGLNYQRSIKEMAHFSLLALMVVLFMMSIAGFFVMWFTEYYNNTILSAIVLRNNSDIAKNWMSPSPKYDTLLKVHIFNYTNIDRILVGKEKVLKVVDVGPLTYKEHTTKVDVAFNSNYTVTFRDHRSYEFLPEKSAIGEFDKFITPNVPLLTAAVKVDSMYGLKKFAATQLINSFNEPVFKRLTAHEFLWGYNDKIVSLDFGTSSSHFGLLMNRNGTSVDSLQINTGEDDIRKFSVIRQFNGEPLMHFWSDEECNRIDGSDGTMFPPHLLDDRLQLHVFLQVLCRKIPLQFEKEVTILNGIDAYRYRTPLNVFAEPRGNANNQCYCHNTRKCLPSGIINATACYNGAPIYPSFPHFFSGDPSIYKDIDGIEPDAAKHQTFADIHPRFAFPISGASRIQINIALHKGSLLRNKLHRLKDGLYLPLIWIEITSGELTDDLIDSLYLSTFGLDVMQGALKYGTLFACILSCSLIVVTYIYLSKRRNKKFQTVNKTLGIVMVKENSNCQQASEDI